MGGGEREVRHQSAWSSRQDEKVRIHAMANRALSDADWNVIEDLPAHERFSAVLQLPAPRWTARFAAELESDPVMAGTRRQARWYRIVAGIHDQPRAPCNSLPE